MLIFHRDNTKIARIINNNKYIFESDNESKISKAYATKSIAKFLVDITKIKNEFSTDPDLRQETRILNDLINNLIRGWSDTAANVCSTIAYKFRELGLTFNGKGRRSNNVKYTNWIHKRQNEMNEGNIEAAKQLLFAVAHSCIMDKDDSRYTMISQLKDECRKCDIRLNMHDYHKIKLKLNKKTLDLLNSFVDDRNYNKNPMFYEHFIPVDDIKKKIYSLIEDKELTDKELLSEIEKQISGMLTCWTTVYENSKIKDATGREDPWQAYKDAGIDLCTREGELINSREELASLV